MGAEMSASTFCGYAGRAKEDDSDPQQLMCTPDELVQVEAAFEKLDEDADGKVSVDDVEKAMAKAFAERTRKELEEYIAAHRRAKPPTGSADASFITRAEWVEFNRRLVLAGRHTDGGGTSHLNAILADGGEAKGVATEGDGVVSTGKDAAVANGMS
mmetsp:Transcript_6017/g.19162  ORF Transcript_6017/g.19162 Transcript_6017/m.19162 type:complete len:157 (+) Transcript_6017:118-588(+)